MSHSEILLNLDSYLPMLRRSPQGEYTGGGKVSLRGNHLPACCQGLGEMGDGGSSRCWGLGSAERGLRWERAPSRSGEATEHAVVRGYVVHTVNNLSCQGLPHPHCDVLRAAAKPGISRMTNQDLDLPQFIQKGLLVQC